MPDTRRCIICGSPACDHLAIRYPLRAAMKHYLFGKARIMFGRRP